MKDWLIVGLLLWLIFAQPIKEFLGFDQDVIETISTETKIDTVYKVIERVVIKEPIITNETKTITVPIHQVSDLEPIDGVIAERDSIRIELPINQYKDSLDVDGAKLYYDHIVAGTLEASKYSIKYPFKTVTNTKKETILANRLLDIYLVGGFQFAPASSTNNRLSGGFDAVFNNFKVGYRLDSSNFGGVNQLNNRLEFGYKIFSL